MPAGSGAVGTESCDAHGVPSAVRHERRQAMRLVGMYLPRHTKVGQPALWHLSASAQPSLIGDARLDRDAGTATPAATSRAMTGREASVTMLLVRDVALQIVSPTLVTAGRDDSIFPPEHQVELATGIPNARLRIVERAGHNAPSERPAEVMRALRRFLSVEVVPGSASASVSS